MTRFRNWFSSGLIRFRPRHQRNAARLIEIAPEWCSAKAQPFSRWKISKSLESEARHVLAEIIGYGISTDNFHITQPDPSGVGPRQAMERALQSAQISADKVDYINAHGTATIFNDAAEGKAISGLFNGVPVSSTKSMMGHSLGAAGAVEAVFCLLALKDQFLPPNINFGALDDGLDLNVVANESRPAVLRTALSNSFGFGGTNASILMSRVEA